MTISDSTVAIIGTGNIGSRLAADFAAGGRDFLVAGRDADAALKIAASAGGHAVVVSVDEAVRRAGVLVIAVWLDDFKQLIAQYGEQLAGKVIVDPSNPVGPDGAGGYRKVIGDQESSGQILAGLLPAGARLVKAFGTLSAPSLSAAARREPCDQRERLALEEIGDRIRLRGGRGEEAQRRRARVREQSIDQSRLPSGSRLL